MVVIPNKNHIIYDNNHLNRPLTQTAEKTGETNNQPGKPAIRQLHLDSIIKRINITLAPKKSS